MPWIELSRATGLDREHDDLRDRDDDVRDRDRDPRERDLDPRDVFVERLELPRGTDVGKSLQALLDAESANMVAIVCNMIER